MNVFALLLLVAAGQTAGAQAQADTPPARHHGSGLWIAGIPFSPADIASATQQWDSLDGTPNVLISFTETGRVKWQRLQQGQVGQQLEISVDGEVVSSPVLREIITGNEVTISGAFTVDEAVALARRIAAPGGRMED